MIVLPVPPSSNRYWKVWKGRAVMSKEARAYKDIVRQIATLQRKQLGWPVEGHVQVDIRWYRQAKRGDLDNRLKVALDALQGIAYANDSQIRVITAQMFDDPKHPRLEVWVSSVSDSSTSRDRPQSGSAQSSSGAPR